MEHTEARGESMAEQRERFARLADPASAPRVVSSFNLFQTPEPLADQLAAMANLADLPDNARILEPSAGLGRLYRAIRHRTAAIVTLIDISPDCMRELYRETAGDENAFLAQGDFLWWEPHQVGSFDRVVMNPPFCRGTDIRHILRALELLKPGGRLVSLCAAGPRQRAFAERIGATWHDLPPGSFASEGTRVAAAIITVDR